MLGLVAMANTVECLYASVKALDCTVGGNPSALKEMEQTGGFQVCSLYECYLTTVTKWFLNSLVRIMSTKYMHMCLCIFQIETLVKPHENLFLEDKSLNLEIFNPRKF